MARKDKPKLMKRIELCTMLDRMSITKWYELERSGVLPEGINIGIGMRWDKNEILEWYGKWKK